MSTGILVFDILLTLSLIGLAIGALRSRDLFQGIVLFILFGLLVAVAWIRVNAPDVALAEAAIGTGITGALFLGALSRIERSARPGSGEDRAPLRSPSATGLVALALTAFLTVVLAISAIGLWKETPALRDLVYEHLGTTGLTNPITAVILDFRSYDTLMEIGVLLIGAIGVYTVSAQAEKLPGELPVASPVLRAFIHLLTPPILITSAYMVWIGSKAPGGAFQAGALLGGAGVILQLAGHDLGLSDKRQLTRIGVAAAFLLFLATATALLVQGNLLRYPTGQAKHYILVIELMATLSIALTLAVVFAGCAGLLAEQRSDPE